MSVTMSTTWTLSDGTVEVINASIPDGQGQQLLAWLSETLPQQNDDAGQPLPRTVVNLIRQWEIGQLVDAANAARNWAAQAAATAAAETIATINPTIT